MHKTALPIAGVANTLKRSPLRGIEKRQRVPKIQKQKTESHIVQQIDSNYRFEIMSLTR
jgi:hypothetical protein